MKLGNYIRFIRAPDLFFYRVNINFKLISISYIDVEICSIILLA